MREGGRGLAAIKTSVRRRPAKQITSGRVDIDEPVAGKGVEPMQDIDEESLQSCHLLRSDGADHALFQTSV